MPTQKNNAKLFAIYRYTFTWFKKYICGSFYIHIFGQSRCKTGFQPKNASKKCHPTNNFPFLLASFEEIAFFLLQFSFSFREFSFHIFSFQSEFFPIFTSIFRHMCEYSSDLHISCVLCHLIWQIFYWIQEIRAFYLHACIQKSLNLWYNGLIIS